MNPKMLKIFFDLALERQRIYIKKEAGEPKPWTDNRIFQDYFFTNVFRDQDKVSKWIIDNVCKKTFSSLDYKHRLLILTRYIGRIETLKDLNLASFYSLKSSLLQRESNGEKIIHGAYITNSCSRPPMQYIFDTIEQMEKVGFENSYKNNSIQKSTEWFKQFPGIAGFMGYEYATDLTYCKEFLSNAEDKFTWANLGPGCNRGINILKEENNLNKRNKNYLEDMQKILSLWKIYFRDMNNIPVRIAVPCIRDIEHWLCEFSKYVKYTCSKGVSFKHRKYSGRC